MGQVTGGYQFYPEGPNSFFHSRDVKWIGEAIPRSHFGKDLLNTFDVFMTVCRAQRNNAETRNKAMHASEWAKETGTAVFSSAPAASEEETAQFDIE